jgi:hypothetical protein
MPAMEAELTVSTVPADQWANRVVVSKIEKKGRSVTGKAGKVRSRYALDLFAVSAMPRAATTAMRSAIEMLAKQEFRGSLMRNIGRGCRSPRLWQRQNFQARANDMLEPCSELLVAR